MADDNNFVTSVGLDPSGFETGIKELQRLIKISETEFQSMAAGLDDWTASEEGLNAKQKQLTATIANQNSILTQYQAKQDKVNESAANAQTRINNLRDAQKRLSDAIAVATAQHGEESKEVKALTKQLKSNLAEQGKAQKKKQDAIKYAQDLQVSINKERTALAKNEKTLSEVNEKLSEMATEGKKASKALKDTGDEGEEADSKLAGFGKSFAGVAVAGAAAIGAAVGAAAVKFLSLADDTREYRTEMAQLKINADEAGVSFDTIKEKLADVTAMTGDSGAAMEGLNMLLATGLDTSQIEYAADALSGAATKFDGLKFEGLAEGLQETLATGTAVGPFAELIERTGYNLDDFNAGLAACTTEAEKQNYVMGWLSKSGLKELGDNYKEQNKELVDAQRAQFEYNDALAELGAIADPIMTSLKMGVAGLLTEVTPNIEAMVNALRGMIAGTEGSAEEFSAAMTGILSTLGANFSNMLPVISNVLQTMVPTLLQILIEGAPSLIQGTTDLFLGILTGLSQALPAILEGLTGAVISIVQGLVDSAPQLLEGALTFLRAIVDALPTVISEIIAALPQLVTSLVDFLTNGYEDILTAGYEMLISIVEAIPSIVTELGEALPQIITTITDKLASWLPELGKKAGELFGKLVSAIGEMLPDLIAKLPEIITTIVQALADGIPKVLAGALDLLLNVVTGIGQAIPDIVAKMPEIITAIVDGIKEGVPKLLQAGKDLIDGLISGILDFKDKVVEKAKEVGSGIVNGIKDFFGIHSPSVVFMSIGEMLMKGLEVGITDEAGNVITAAEAQAKGIESVYVALAEDGTALGAGVSQNIAQGFISQADDSTAAIQQSWEDTYDKMMAKIKKDVEEEEEPEEAGKTLWESLMDGFSEGKGQMAGMLQQTVSSLASGGDILSAAGDLGQSLVSSIAQGIGGWGGMAVSAAGSLISTIIGRIRAGKEEAQRLAAEAEEEARQEELKQAKEEAARARAELYTYKQQELARASSEISTGVKSLGDNANSVTNVTINQTNNSPKALSRAEIYRQTRNAVGLAVQGI